MVSADKALQQYPVKYGDHWRIGPHHFWCKDFITVDWPPMVELGFTDPPWNDRVQKQFYARAGLSDSPSLAIVYGELAEVLCEHTRKTIVWSGRKHFDLLKKTLVAYGLRNYWTVEATYSRQRRPYWVIGGSFDGSTLPRLPEHLHEDEVVRWAARELRPESVIDPCCGRLLFGRVFVAGGATFYGSEIIPGKLARGFYTVGRDIACEPLRIIED